MKQSFSDQIRNAIADAGVSRYRIAKDTGVSESALSRFVTGKAGLMTPKLDAVADYLGLRVVSDAKATETKRTVQHGKSKR